MKKRNAGFTLIEILVSVAILSIIIAALYSTFFLSQKAVAGVDDTLLKLQECRNAVDTIKREIESAVYSKDKPYSVFKIDDRDFYGRQASQLSFTAFSNIAPGLSKISYVAEEDNGHLILRKRISTAYSESSENKDIDLMEDIESFTIETKYNDRWVRTWDSTLSNSIPEEVRIHVAISVKNGQDKISIYDIARPRIGRTI